MTLLDIVIVILLISWVAGFSFSIAGSFIHLLLLIAVIALVFRLLGLRR